MHPKERSLYMETFGWGFFRRVSSHAHPFLLLHNMTFLKDFCNFSLINFSPIHSHQTSLCLTLPPPSHFSSPFVRLCWLYRWQYRLRLQCIGTKSWGKQWGKGDESGDKTRWMKYERQRRVFTKACQLFFITIMTVLLSPYPPTNISYSRRVGSLLSQSLLNGKWALILSRKGRRSIHPVDPVWDRGKGTGLGLRTGRGSGQCHICRQRIRTHSELLRRTGTLSSYWEVNVFSTSALMFLSKKWFTLQTSEEER